MSLGNGVRYCVRSVRALWLIHKSCLDTDTCRESPGYMDYLSFVQLAELATVWLCACRTRLSGLVAPVHLVWSVLGNAAVCPLLGAVLRDGATFGILPGQDVAYCMQSLLHTLCDLISSVDGDLRRAWVRASKKVCCEDVCVKYVGMNECG